VVWGRDGIFIEVEKQHGEFPIEIEGAKIRLKPAVRAKLLSR
jgi:hypothetical protein